MSKLSILGIMYKMYSHVDSEVLNMSQLNCHYPALFRGQGLLTLSLPYSERTRPTHNRPMKQLYSGKVPSRLKFFFEKFVTTRPGLRKQGGKHTNDLNKLHVAREKQKLKYIITTPVIVHRITNSPQYMIANVPFTHTFPLRARHNNKLL